MKWTPDLLKQHYDERLGHLQDEFIRELDGFPQEYAKRSEVDVLRSTLDSIRTDHVQRREYDDLKNAISESRGGRIAIAAAVSIIITVLVVTFGLLERSVPTNDEIVNIVKTTAPWLDDKPVIEQRLRTIERRDQLLELQIQRLQDRVKLICVSHKHNPGC